MPAHCTPNPSELAYLVESGLAALKAVQDPASQQQPALPQEQPGLPLQDGGRLGALPSSNEHLGHIAHHLLPRAAPPRRGVAGGR